jgi:subtilisin family serine protease
MKRLLLFLLFILILVFTYFICKSKHESNCIPIDPLKAYANITEIQESENTLPEGVPVTYKENQIIISNAVFYRDYYLNLGYKSIKRCACAQDYELLEVPESIRVRGIPEGAEQTGGNTSGTGSSISIRNSVLEDNVASISNIANSSIKAGDPIFINNNQNPEVGKIKVAIVDTGVDTSKYDIVKYLYKNEPNSIVCNNESEEEGLYGVNLYSTVDVESTGKKITLPSNSLIPRTVMELNVIYPEPKDLDGHGSIINMIIGGFAKHKNRDFLETLQYSYSSNFIEQINVKFAANRVSERTLFDALCGVHYALNKGAKVINASWRAIGKGDYYLKFFKSTLEKLRAKDALLVVGAGNDYRIDIDGETKAWPAALADSILVDRMYPGFRYNNHIITVGAWYLGNSESRDSITDFTNFGDKTVSIYAPGQEITVPIVETVDGYRWKIGKGTSYAAPFVTRNAAIYFGLNSGITAFEVKNRIIYTAEKVNVTFSDNAHKVRNQTIRVLKPKIEIH